MEWRPIDPTAASTTRFSSGKNNSAGFLLAKCDKRAGSNLDGIHLLFSFLKLTKLTKKKPKNSRKSLLIRFNISFDHLVTGKWCTKGFNPFKGIWRSVDPFFAFSQ
jgi:hypothetical protein